MISKFGKNNDSHDRPYNPETLKIMRKAGLKSANRTQKFDVKSVVAEYINQKKEAEFDRQ